MGHPVYECTFSSSSGPRAFGAVPGAAVRGGGRPGGLLQDGLPPPQVSRRDVLLQGRRQWQEREKRVHTSLADSSTGWGDHLFRRFCKPFSGSSPGCWAVLQLPCCPSKQGELLENILQNLRNKWLPHPRQRDTSPQLPGFVTRQDWI